MEQRLWTAAGFARQEALIRRYEREYHSFAQMLASARGDRSSTNEDRQTELVPIVKDRDFTHQKLEDAKKLRSCLRIAPAPTQTDYVQVGSEVDIEYLDNCARRKRGEHETIIIGGDGEVDEDSIVRTFSCTAAFGKALIRAEAGDTIVVQPQGSKSYRLMVKAIRVPSPTQAATVQTA